jgi:DNA-binding response OmpR family regulator
MESLMSTERILVVEDEEEVARFIEKTLCTLGYAVTALANTGELAISRAINVKPDLVLMDIGLDGALDGIEAAKRIHLSLDVPVVFLTAMRDEETFLRAKSAEPFGFLLKPFNCQEMGNVIGIALYQHHRSQKQVVMAVRETEEACRATYQNAAAGVVSEALQGKSLNANPLLLGILGCNSYEELLVKGKQANEVFHPKMREAPIGAESSEIALQPRHFIFQTYGPDGCTKWISTTAHPARKIGDGNSFI